MAVSAVFHGVIQVVSGLYFGLREGQAVAASAVLHGVHLVFATSLCRPCDYEWTVGAASLLVCQVAREKCKILAELLATTAGVADYDPAQVSSHDLFQLLVGWLPIQSVPVDSGHLYEGLVPVSFSLLTRASQRDQGTRLTAQVAVASRGLQAFI